MQKGFNVVNLHGTASGVIAVPVIGENGNWWIGNEDTGAPAQGPKGETGEPGSAGIGSEKIYSEEEHVVGKWIDGKTIYERTYAFYNISNSCKLSEAIENVEHIINIGGFAECYYKVGSTFWTWPINTAVAISEPYFLEVYYWKANPSDSKAGLRCKVKLLPEESHKNIFVTLQYTKLN